MELYTFLPFLRILSLSHSDLAVVMRLGRKQGVHPAEKLADTVGLIDASLE